MESDSIDFQFPQGRKTNGKKSIDSDPIDFLIDYSVVHCNPRRIWSGRCYTDRMPELPPGPRTPSPVQILQWVFRPIPFMQRCAETYGAAFTTHIMGPRPLVFFSDPAAIRQIFTGDAERLQAGRANSLVFRLILGSNSLLSLDGARHRRERKLLAPPFHGERMRLYGDMMCGITDRSIDSWPVETPFPIQARMQEITLDIILRAVFGVYEDARHSRLRALLVEYQRVMVGRNFFLALVAWRRLARLQRAIDRLLYDEIGRCRTEAQAGRTDIMAMLAAARDEDGRPMSDGEIRDELITMLLAGHETTAVSLAWVFQRMLQNPDVLAAARAEVASVIGDGAAAPMPGAEQVAELSYLDAVIKETARLNPVAPVVVRLLATDLHIGGYDLPAGSIAAPCIYLAHRAPDLWPDAEEFKPERFLTRRVDPYTFFPFGGGARYCIGAAFANYEMKIVLARVLSKVKLRAYPDYRVRTIRRGVTFAPSGGMPVIRSAG